MGIPVRIHPMFWLLSLLLGPFQGPPVYSLLWVTAVLICILLHEFGHATVMRWYGYHPWIVLHGFGGLAMYNPGEFVTRRPKPLGQIAISLAGPLSGFLLTIVILVGFALAGYVDRIGIVRVIGPIVLPVVVIPDHLYVTYFLAFIFQIAIFWGLINLLPIYPLDGGQIAQQIFTLFSPRDAMRQSLILSVLVAGTMVGVFVIYTRDPYLAIFFGYLAYSSYAMLQ